MKSFLFRSVIGIFMGGFLAAAVTSLIAVIGGLETLDSGMFIKNAAGFIFCAWFFSVSPLYFENENWSLLRQSVYHFLTVLVLYFVTAFGIGWFHFTWLSFLSFIGLFLAIYAIIWLSFYWYYANEAKKLNEGLKGL